MTTPRIIVRNAGPAGPKGATGDPGNVTGPVVSVNNRVAVFDGTTGKKIKDSGILISALATAASVALKQDAVPGKGLSTEDFTTAEKAKLAYLAGAYRGSFANLAAVEANDFDPAPAPGDFCLIEVEAEPVILVLWDETNLEWTEFSKESVPMTGEEIAAALFRDEDLAGYTKALCRNFTHSDKANLDLVVSQVSSVVASIVASQSAYVEKTATYTATLADKTINCTDNSFTISLPTAVGQASRIYTIKNSGTGTITIDPFGTETIDGDTTVALTTQWESITIQSTGTNWIII